MISEKSICCKGRCFLALDFLKLILSLEGWFIESMIFYLDNIFMVILALLIIALFKFFARIEIRHINYKIIKSYMYNFNNDNFKSH